MMTFDYGGDGEPRGNAQLGLHHHPRVVHPPLKRRPGKLCCLSARPPDIADLTGTRPRVVVVSPSIVPCVYSKRAALTRSLVAFFTNERFVRFLCALAVDPPLYLTFFCIGAMCVRREKNKLRGKNSESTLAVLSVAF